jgi:hypothetical protein
MTIDSHAVAAADRGTELRPRRDRQCDIGPSPGLGNEPTTSSSLGSSCHGPPRRQLTLLLAAAGHGTAGCHESEPDPVLGAGHRPGLEPEAQLRASGMADGVTVTTASPSRGEWTDRTSPIPDGLASDWEKLPTVITADAPAYARASASVSALEAFFPSKIVVVPLLATVNAAGCTGLAPTADGADPNGSTACTAGSAAAGAGPSVRRPRHHPQPHEP